MTAIPSSVQSPNYTFPTHWCTPDDVLENLVPKKMLEQKFPKPVPAMIIEYGDYSKLSLWYELLKKINALPERVPPLRQDISQILESVCSINANTRKVIDFFSLYLIPAGQTPAGFIKTLDDTARLCGWKEQSNFLENYGWFFSSIRTLETVGFAQSEWVLVSKLLPESTQKKFSEQVSMIHNFAKKFFVHHPSLICEFPRFKYVMAANLLKIQHKGVGHWIQEGQSESATRVEECFRDCYPGEEECFWKYIHVSTHCLNGDHFPSYGSSHYLLESSKIGVAAVVRGLSPVPKRQRKLFSFPFFLCR